MHDKEHQHVHRPMPRVVELLLFDRSRDRSADRVTLQDLEGRDLIDAHHPDASFGKSLRIPVAPKDLLRSLFEAAVQPRRLPVPRPMGLQIDVVQDAANRCRTDRWDGLVSHRLAGQILAGPVGDVQPLGDRLQTGQLNDLCSLDGGNLLRAACVGLSAIGEQTGQATLAITLAGPPNRGFIAFEPGSDRTLSFSSRDSQHDLGSLHLKPGKGTTVSDAMKSVLIAPSNSQFLWSAPTHEVTSLLMKGQSSA